MKFKYFFTALYSYYEFIYSLLFLLFSSTRGLMMILWLRNIHSMMSSLLAGMRPSNWGSCRADVWCPDFTPHTFSVGSHTITPVRYLAKCMYVHQCAVLLRMFLWLILTWLFLLRSWCWMDRCWGQNQLQWWTKSRSFLAWQTRSTTTRSLRKKLVLKSSKFLASLLWLTIKSH